MFLRLPVPAKVLLIFIAITHFFSTQVDGQSNPTAQALPYTQAFSTFDGSMSAYPPGFQGWNIPGTLSASVITTAPSSNKGLVVEQTNASALPFIGDMVGKIGMLSSSSSVEALCLAVNTSSVTSGNVQIIYTVATQGQTAGGFIDELDLQYRVGTSGSFTTVSGAVYQNDALVSTNTAVTTAYNPTTLYVTLPAACTNHSNVQLRWIPRNVSGSGTTHPSFSIANITVQAQTTTDYYCLSSGNLNIAATWVTAADGSGTHPANFTTAGQVFHVVNGNPGILSANWIVSGANSKVIVDQTDLTTSTSKTITATIDVNVNRTLTISNLADTTSITLGTLDQASTVVFSGLTNMPVPTNTVYGNVTFNNSTVEIPLVLDTLQFAGNLILQGSSSFIGATASSGLGINLATYGNNSQIINANGLPLSVWNLDIGFSNSKSAGTIALGPNTTINAYNHFEGNLGGTSVFADNGNSITIGNNLDLSGNASNYNFTGTIWMNGITSGSQYIRGGTGSPIAAAVNNIVFNSQFIPAKLGGGTFVIKGNMVITDTAAFGLDFQGFAVALTGNFINRSHTDLLTMVSPATMMFSGTAIQSYTSAVPGGSTFYDLTMNNSTGLVLNNSMNISGTLTLTNGLILAGSDTLNIVTGGSVSGANTSSYVKGYMSKVFGTGTGSARTFEIGDTTYAPVTLTFPGSITFPGPVLMKSTYGPHPSMSSSYVSTANYVNRYWNIVNEGVTVASGNLNASFSYTNGDMTGTGNSNYIIREYASSAWGTSPSVSNITTGVAPLLADVSKTTGVTASSFSGDYVIGNPDCTTSGGAATGLPASLCGSGSSALSLTGSTTNTGNSYQWQSSPTGASWTAISGATTATYVTPAISSTTYYRCTVGCIPTATTVNSAVAIVTVNPVPSSISGTTFTCAGSGQTLSDLTGGGTWSSSNTSVVTIGSTGVYSGPLAGTSTISYTLSTGCAATVAVSNLALPNPPSVSSLLMSFCPASTATLLTATADTVTGAATGTNNTTTFAEAKNSPGTSTIAISSIPPGATVTSIVVSFTIAGAGAFQKDNILNLSAPNGNKINLIDNTGSATTGPFNNVTIGSAGTTPIVSGTNVVPGILYAANHINNVPAAFSATYKSNTTAWSGLYSVPNGNWTFITDNTFNATEDTFKSWSISISYVINPTITWSPITGLYTNTSGAAYTTGTSTNNIYVLPTATTIYTVTTTSGSCSNSTGVEAIFGNPLYVPVVQGQSAICQGATTNLSDSLSGGVWTSSNTSVATIGSISGVVSGSGAGTATITYSITNGGCSGQATKVITVTASPAAISGNLALCVGATTALSDADAGSWSISNANASIGTSGIVTGVSAGLDTVLYVSPIGCTTIGVVSVNVIPTLSGVSASSNVLCAGGSFTLNAGASAGTGAPTSYNWSGPGGFVATGVTASTTVTPATIAGSGIYSLSVSYAGVGCTTAVSVISPAVTVNAIPTIGSVTSSASLLCAGATFTLTAAGASGIGALSSYNWSGPGGYFASGATGSVALTPVTTAASGVYSLSVTYPGSGCTSASAITSPAVTVNALPTVAAINASAYTLCAGSNFTLTAGITSGAGSLTSYIWSGPNGFATTNTTGTATLTSATTAASGIYTVIVTYPGLGCASAASVTSPAIFVNTLPTVSGIMASANSLCIGGSFSLNAGSVAGAGSLTSYNWRGPNGYSATGLTTSVVVTPSTTLASGVYSLSVTYPGTGCTSTASVTSPAVTVNVLPTVSGVVSSVNSLCAGGTFTLTAGSAAGAGSLISYNWSGPNAYSATGAVNSAVITPTTTAASGVYSLTVTYPGSGCTSNVSVASPAVTVNTQPAAISGTSSLCNLTTTFFNDLTPGGAWSAGNSNVTIDGSGNVTGASFGSSTISYIIGSCFATKTITVNAAPPAISGMTIVCLGATTPLSDDQVGGTWASSGGSVTIDGSGNVTGTSAGTAVITYSLGGSCSTNATVTVNDLPTVGGLSASSALLCAGGTFTLTAGTASGTGSLTSYNWSGPGGYAATSTTATIGLSPSTTASSGIYSLAVSYPGAGCISSVTVIASAVTVNALPVSSGATNAGAVCEGAVANLFANSSNATAWIWSGPGGFSSTVQNPTFTPTATATYSLSVSSTGIGCSPSAVYTTTITVNSLPGSILGTDSVYISSSVTLSDTAAGGTWTADNGNVSVGSSTGAVSGVSAGTSLITYTLSTGCTATFVVTVLAVPPAITGVTNLCSGSLTELSDLITGGTWSSSNDNVTVGSTSGIVNGITAGTSVITYTFPSAAIAVYATITVNPLPSAILGSTQVCQGLMTSVSDTSSTGNWAITNDNATVVSTTGIITGVTPGIDTVIYTISVTGCAISTVVTINTLPSSISGSSQVCVGSSITLTDVGGGTWSSSNGNAGIGSDGIVTGAGEGTSTITYELSTGCISNLVLTVNPLPNTITGAGNVCVSSMISLTDGGGGTWSSSNANVLISSTGTVTGMTAGTSQITYTLSTGCIITTNVTVNPVVIPSLTLSETAGDTVCSGTAVIFTATPVGGGATPTYQWAVNSSVIPGATSGSYNYMPLNSDTVSVAITSDAVCATPAVVSSAVTMTVLSIDTSSVHISAAPGDTVCNGSFAVFSAVAANGGTDPMYLWSVNGTAAGSGISYGYFPNASDDVYCKMVSNQRCIATDTVSSNHIVMQVDSAYIPIVEIVATQGPGAGPFQIDTFRAAVVNAGPVVTYQWFVNTTAVSGATTSVFTASDFANNDSVSCVVTSAGPCGYASFNSVKVTIAYAGVQPVTNTVENVRLIPNPNKGQFTVKGALAGMSDGSVALEITDMLGQVIYRSTIKPVNGIIDEPVALSSELANGMYLLNLRSGGENVTLHFVIGQ